MRAVTTESIQGPLCSACYKLTQLMHRVECKKIAPSPHLQAPACAITAAASSPEARWSLLGKSPGMGVFGIVLSACWLADVMSDSAALALSPYQQPVPLKPSSDACIIFD